MIISHKYKFIFIHIPRNGGSSIIEYLADKLGKDVLNTDSVSCKKNGNVYLNDIDSHIKMKDLMKYLDLNYKNYFKFCIVRNPLDRLISLYKFYKYGFIWNNKDTTGSANNVTFKDFIHNNVNLNNKISIFSQNKHKYVNQYDWISDDDDKLLVDYIGKYEDFKNTLEFISNKINIDITNINHINKNKGVHEKIEYDISIINTIKEIYKKDYKYLYYDTYTMTSEIILNKIINIDTHIKDDFYGQLSSPDSWCFYCLSLININKIEKAKQIFEDKINCNKFHVTNITKKIDAKDIILYTNFWIYYVMFKLNLNTQELYKICDSIDVYQNKNYILYTKNYNYKYYVPNIQPMYVYISLLENKTLNDKSKLVLKELVNDYNPILKNFHYFIDKGGIIEKFKRNGLFVLEDYKHLPMMYYCFKNILILLEKYKIDYLCEEIKKIINDIEENVIDIATKIISNKIIIQFNGNKTSSKQYINVNNKEIILSSIGWHNPWILLVLFYVKEKNMDLFNIYLERNLNEYGINHTNLRVRAMASWVLSLIYR